MTTTPNERNAELDHAIMVMETAASDYDAIKRDWYNVLDALKKLRQQHADAQGDAAMSSEETANKIDRVIRDVIGCNPGIAAMAAVRVLEAIHVPDEGACVLEGEKLAKMAMNWARDVAHNLESDTDPQDENVNHLTDDELEGVVLRCVENALEDRQAARATPTQQPEAACPTPEETIIAGDDAANPTACDIIEDAILQPFREADGTCSLSPDQLYEIEVGCAVAENELRSRGMLITPPTAHSEVAAESRTAEIIISEQVNRIYELEDQLKQLEQRHRWQSIETAPKDGTPFMSVRRFNGGWWYAHVAWRFGSFTFENDGDSGVAVPDYWQQLPEPPNASEVKP